MKANWGQKRYCRKCETYFYDMARTEFQCPGCHAAYGVQDFMVKAKSDVKRKKVDQTQVVQENQTFEPMDVDPELETVLIDDVSDIDGDDDDEDVTTAIDRESEEE